MNAVAAYCRELRMYRGLTQRNLAQAIGLSERQYARWEAQQTGINDEAMLKLVSVLQAPTDHIRYLLSEDVTEEQGKLFAQRWLAEIAAESQDMRDERIDRAQSLIDALRANPRALDRLVGYGERLLEERDD